LFLYTQLQQGGISSLSLHSFSFILNIDGKYNSIPMRYNYFG